jgi:SAM-dependent methyltransferase
MNQGRYLPDPAKGIEASAQYAEHYAASHRVPPSWDYKQEYIHLVMIDALLSDYVLLHVGCGTGGFFRLARNHKKIIGLDFSKAMIDKARDLAKELGLKRVEFVYKKFEDYDPSESFDAVNLAGAIGWYVPWIGKDAILAKTHAMLKPGGLAVLSFVKPRGWLQLLKAVLFPGKTVLIREPRFFGMIQKAGFERLFSIDVGRNVYVFCRRPAPGAN